MTPSGEPADPLARYWAILEGLYAAVSRSTAVNVNATDLRDQARAAVQHWFRDARPYVLGLSVSEDELRTIDSLAQRLLTLAAGRNAKTSYISTLRSLRKCRGPIEGRAHMLQGTVLSSAAAAVSLAPVEARILATLERMLPDSALSYRQVLQDLAGPQKYSYRGTATELREVVREVLDHLAPDEEVMKATGFKLEKDRKAPTMRQKARFILKARGLGETARKAPEEAVELLEDQIASLARSVYERGSASTHSSTRIEAVRNFKGYADAVLAELLQVHK